MKLPSNWTTRIAVAAAGIGLLLLVRCMNAPPATTLEAPRAGYSIVACGERFDIDSPVVLWEDPDGYSAYRRGKHFADEPLDGELRYGKRPGDPQTLAELREQVHAFVLHFDTTGTSRQCFKVLQDKRTLSVHFMLDVDGTIYQTLDLRERAWHATISNDFAVGVEIAHPGAWPQPLNADMRRWYEKDEIGWRMKTPKWMKDPGIRTKGYIARPARKNFVSGEVQGRTMHQFDFTKEQYAALAKLAAGLSRALPRIRLAAPRTPAGEIVNHKVADAELRAFEGLIGHFHVQTNKVDPGPAMQWDRLIEDARRERARWPLER
ncbi:MAG: N-acetylmuramoyl-L-alanine amidase [bacterium]|nr:N-acetylmuramoyl-L-alanine amidase [bacterium]